MAYNGAENLRPKKPAIMAPPRRRIPSDNKHKAQLVFISILLGYALHGLIDSVFI